MAQLPVDVAQPGDVGDGIGALLVGQRTRRPVGEAGGLVEFNLADRADEAVIGCAVPKAADTGRHLGVEDVMRHRPGELDEDLHILARGVEHLGHIGIGQESEKRGQLDVGREGVDQHRFVVRRHLDQAKPGPIGRLTQKFGIDRHKFKLGSALAEFGKHVCGNNEVHTHYRLKIVNILPSRCSPNAPPSISLAVKARKPICPAA
ncbi:hypothetical protein D3C87_1432590 [compost metagenome]